jgi:hypothetical protein
MKSVHPKRRINLNTSQSRLSLVEPSAPTRRSAQLNSEPETYELRLSFGELALIYKSLEAVKTLGALPPQDELLNDTIQLIDQELNRATMRRPSSMQSGR